MVQYSPTDCFKVVVLGSILQEAEFESIRAELIKKGINIKSTIKNPPDFSNKLLRDIMTSSNIETIVFTSEKFEILVDARGYRPSELKCIVYPHYVEIVANHLDAVGTTRTKTSLSRNYQLPQGANPQQAHCFLSSEGFLLVTAPWLQ